MVLVSGDAQDGYTSRYSSFGLDHPRSQVPFSSSPFLLPQRYLANDSRLQYESDYSPEPQAYPASCSMNRDFYSFPSSYSSPSHFPFQSSSIYSPFPPVTPSMLCPSDAVSSSQYRSRHVNPPLPPFPSPTHAELHVPDEVPSNYHGNCRLLFDSRASSTEPHLQHFDFQPAVNPAIFPLSDSYEPLSAQNPISTFPYSFTTPFDENRRYSWPLSNSFDASTLQPLEFPLPPSLPPPTSLQAHPIETDLPFSWMTNDWDEAEEEEEKDDEAEEQENELLFAELVSEIPHSVQIGHEGNQQASSNSWSHGDVLNETEENQSGKNERRSEREGEAGGFRLPQGLSSGIVEGEESTEGGSSVRRSERRVPQISQVPQIPQSGSNGFAPPPPPRKKTKRSSTTTQTFSSNEDWSSDINFWSPFQASTTLIDQRGELIGFSTTITNPSSFYYDQELETWLTYRRNFLSFEVSITFNLPIPLSSLHTSTNTSPISHMKASLYSFTHPRGSPVALLQFDTSRSLAKSIPVQAQQLSPHLSRINRNSTSTLTSQRCLTYSTTFARIQFTASTSKNPNAQSASVDYYFANQVSLVAIHDDDTETEIGGWRSARLIVRGRSPGQFEKSKKRKETAAVASSRKRKETRMSGSLSK
ncbi:hypothetical protein JCM5350_006182 [Sporobolomyces pararoseus]